MRAMKLMLLAACVAAAYVAHADELPSRLTIGYEQEGAVDGSPAACLATVKELVEWPEAEMKEAAKTLCAARKAHIDAYDALQKSYRHFAKVFGEDTRLNTGESVAQFAGMLKACIDHKSGITTGGHNVAIDIIPNHIAANCLEWGRRMLDDETAWYEAPAETHQRASP